MSTSAQTATLVPLNVQAVETESLLFDSFLRVYDSLLNGSSDQTLSTLSEKEVEAIRELYGRLSKLPLRDYLAALWCLRDARLVHDSLSYSQTRAIVERFTTPSRDSPALSLPDVYTQPREWSPDVHTNLPSPEEVFNAPVLSKQGRSIVAKVTETLVVKYGQCISLREVAAILYVSAHTSVPVPQIHGAYEYKSELFLFMEFIPGRTLEDAWPDMTAASKDALTEQLRVHMNSLRLLRRMYIGGLGCTPCFDHIFADEPPSDCGPFPNVAAFHDTLAKAINRYGDPEGFPTSRSKRRLFKDDYRIVFSHGDFASRNIMVSEEGKLAAILDWETAGFWPEYWEWMKASIDIESEPYDWGDVFDLILEPFDADALIENMFLRVLLL